MTVARIVALAVLLIVAAGIGTDCAYASTVNIHFSVPATHVALATKMPVGIVERGADGKAYFCPARGCFRGAPHH